MVQFNFTYDVGISIEQMVGFEMAAAVWSHYLTDDITINLHIVSVNTLGDDGEAVGGAVPLFHEVQYGVFQEYYENDISSSNDTQADGSLDEGNTVDLMINGELVDGNTNLLLTSAQAKALGMDEALLLDNGTTWDRNLVDPNALDGYIIVNQSFDWNYDFARKNDAPEGALDFFSMALHEIGHQLGFVSGIDGTLDVLQLHSGETSIQDFTVLDLFRHTIDSGSVSDVTLGTNAYFSLDNGVTNIADFSTGNQDEDYQASHWKRFQTAIGIMDPTLAYKERLTLTNLDLQAFDVLGYDINTNAIGDTLQLKDLLLQAEAKVSLDLGIDLAQSTDANGGNELYKLGYSGWWDLFEKQIHELGYSGWWDIFELGKSYWEQELAGTLELGYSGWWQLFDEKMQELESQMLALGYSGWWQEFQSDMLALGYSGWWEVFELGYSGWWQKLDNYFSKLEETNGENNSIVDQILNGTDPNQTTQTTTGGDEDDIIGGNSGRDLISGLKGDDLIDGKSGADILMGDEGDDMIYGLDGDDVIYGGEGDDFLSGEGDNDQLYGEAGADVISGGAGDDFLSGGFGRDVLKGDQGKDVLVGGTGDDILEGGENNDLLLGGQGKDLIDGGEGDDILRGDYYPSNNTSTNTNYSEPNLKSLQALLGLTGEITTTSGVDYWLRLEAESMILINSNQQTNSSASGGSVVTTGGNGKLRKNFAGATGTYDLVVSYYDSSNGQGKITLEVNYQDLDSWILNGDNNGFVTRTIKGVNLTNGDRIQLRGEANGNEFIQIDYLDIIAVKEGSTYNYNSLTANNQINLVQGTNNVKADSIRIEAEAMTLSNGYVVEARNNFTSGNGVITNSLNGQKATANYTFTGNSGTYNIFASYLDGIGGQAKAEIKINGTTVNAWEFNKNNGLSEYRLVGLNIAVNQGDIVTIIGEANSSDLAKFDYLNFVPVLTQQLDADADIVPDYIQKGTTAAGRVEAELMTLGGTHYKIESASFASGGKVVKTDESNTGMTVTTTFTGDTGLYNIVLGYYDGNDGIAKYQANLNGIQQLDSWNAQLNLGNADPLAQTFVTRTFARQILLNPGDKVQLQAIRGGNDRAYIDYIQFEKYDPTAAIRVEAEYMNATGDYKLENYTFASGGRVLRSEKSDDLANALKLNTVFQGESGQYTIKVYYFDENDGNAQFTASLNGSLINSWVANSNLGSGNVELKTSFLRTIGTNIELKTGDVFQVTSMRNSGDYGRIDYVEFVPYVAGANLEGTTIQLEVEDMQLTGEKVKVEKKNFAYGGAYVTTDDDKIGLTASTLFTGEEGYYNVILGYYDTNKGQANVTVKLNEDELKSWVLNQNLGTDKAGVNSFTTYTVAQGVYLEKNDTLQIIGRANGSDKVYADYLKLIPVEAPISEVEIQSISNSNNGDILRGGAGNDQLYGETGNDILYGENEYDTPNSITAGNDTLVGGSGDDVLYGNSGNDVLYGDEITPIQQNLSLPQGAIVYNNSAYLLSTASSWINAQVQAETLGGNLVTINDAAENQFLLNTFGGTQILWLGLTDQDKEGTFKWISGETVTYSNWTVGLDNQMTMQQDKIMPF
jgi:Ca2+-binding RTX toxin-like protein